MKCDTKCEAIMTVDSPRLREDDPVGVAFEMLLRHRVLTLPVVDAQGRYVGMFGKHRILSLLVPMLSGTDDRLPTLARLRDYASEDDSIDDIRRRLNDIGSDPVGFYAEKDAPTLTSDAPLSQALQLLYQTRNYLPVLGEDGKLEGMLTTWDALERIADKK
ncbi:MAG: HPP family protein [Alphaproteobacteria bacterium]